MGIVELENGDVVGCHVFVVKPSVAVVVAHFVDFIGKVWVDHIHRDKIFTIDCAGITQGERGVLDMG